MPPKSNEDVQSAQMAFDQALEQIEIQTRGEGFTNLTPHLEEWVARTGVIQGVLHVTALHTSCSLIINENADPFVLSDLSAYMKSLVPEEGIKTNLDIGIFNPYKHSNEGPDDMPAHIRTSLTCSNLSLSIDKRKLVLGTWQAIYLWEHRNSQHSRRINLHAIGEKNIPPSSKQEAKTSTLLALRNGQKINALINKKQHTNELGDEPESQTDVDLLIDRLHELAGEDA